MKSHDVTKKETISTRKHEEIDFFVSISHFAVMRWYLTEDTKRTEKVRKKDTEIKT